jgi:hypothetical protein
MKFLRLIQIPSVAALLLAGFQVTGQERGPIINDRFPIKDPSELSSPIVSPVGECAKAVHLSGFIAHATIRVFVNATLQVGIAQPYFAEADIQLTQALNLGDKVTATQEVLGITSAQSIDPAIVGPYPSALNKPVAGPDLFSCGRVVPVDQLNPGTNVSVFKDGSATPIGEVDATQAWEPV